MYMKPRGDSMQNRHGIIEKDIIEAVRRSLQRKYNKDGHIQTLLEDLMGTQTVSGEDREIICHAYEEVRQRIYYEGLLDSLWEQVEEIQLALTDLHVYRSLEKGTLADEITARGLLIENEEDEGIAIETVDLHDMEFSEAGDLVTPKEAFAKDLADNTKGKAKKKKIKEVKKDKKEAKNKKEAKEKKAPKEKKELKAKKELKKKKGKAEDAKDKKKPKQDEKKS